MTELPVVDARLRMTDEGGHIRDPDDPARAWRSASSALIEGTSAGAQQAPQLVFGSHHQHFRTVAAGRRGWSGRAEMKGPVSWTSSAVGTQIVVTGECRARLGGAPVTIDMLLGLVSDGICPRPRAYVPPVASSERDTASVRGPMRRRNSAGRRRRR